MLICMLVSEIKGVVIEVNRFVGVLRRDFR